MPEVPDTVDEAIDAAGDTPTTDEIVDVTRSFSSREIASAAISRGAEGGGGGGGPFSVASVTLTNAQIKALNSSQVEILAAPGANSVYIPIFAVLHMSPWVADYTNIDANCILIVRAGANILGNLREDTSSNVSQLLAGGGPDGTWATLGHLDEVISSFTAGRAGYYDSDIVNQAMIIVASNGSSGNFTGGNAGNGLIVTVYYATITF